jgi:hypothetical protein
MLTKVNSQDELDTRTRPPLAYDFGGTGDAFESDLSARARKNDLPSGFRTRILFLE